MAVLWRWETVKPRPVAIYEERGALYLLYKISFFMFFGAGHYLTKLWYGSFPLFLLKAKKKERKRNIDTYMLYLPYFIAMTVQYEDENFKTSDE